MTEKNQIYKCLVCGNVVEVVNQGPGTLVCCGQPMNLLKEIAQDVGVEKHLPVIEKTSTGIKVKVGDVPHPMLEEHHIMWIEVIADGVVYRKNLNPGDKPEADFCIKADTFSVREHCNIHGVWKTSN